jgi:hypothetical protein
MEDFMPLAEPNSVKQNILHYLKLIVSIGLIVWGCEFLTGLVNRPDVLSNWLGPVMIVAGTVLGIYLCYIHRRGASFVGVVLLLFVGLYAWNLSYWYDPTRVPDGMGPPGAFFVAPAVLTLLGVFFLVFFRYLYSVDERPTEKATPAAPSLPPENQQPTIRSAPWHRLLLLVCAVAVALIAGSLSGVEEAVPRTQIILTVLVLGCLAAGLITEKTLIKIIPWKKG